MIVMKKSPLAWLEIAGNVLFWLFSGWFILYFFSIESQEFEIIDGQEFTKISRSGVVVKGLLANLIFSLFPFYFNFFGIKKLNKSLSIHTFWWQSAGVLLLSFLGYFVVSRFVISHFPLVVPLEISVGIFAFYFGGSFGYGFLKLWSRNERERQHLLLSKREAELNVLKAQLQPHFLFNTLNNLLAMVDQQANPKLADSIGRLSGLLRYVVYDTSETRVSVEKEINFLKDFATLHLLRFEEGEIDFRFEVEGDFTQQAIEPGIFIPFLENAFKHGVQPETTSFVYLKMDVSAPEVVKFRLENSLHTPVVGSSRGVGLALTKERLALVYPQKHTLSIRENETYVVELSLQTHESNYS